MESGTGRDFAFGIWEESSVTGCCRERRIAFGICKENWVGVVSLDVPAKAVSVLRTGISAPEPSIEIVPVAMSSCESRITAERESRLLAAEGEREGTGVESGSGSGRDWAFSVRESPVTGCFKEFCNALLSLCV
jgi:hypothetical protein